MNFLNRLPGLSATVAHAVISVALLAAALGAVFALSGPQALAEAVTQVKVSSIVLIAILLAAGIGLSAFRLTRIAANLGYTLSLRDAVTALTIGQIAGNLFFQFFGQLAGRTMVLAGRGIPPAASVVLFGYERIFALLVSLGLAVCGAVYLFGQLHFDLREGGSSLIRIGLGLGSGIVAGGLFAWGHKARRVWRAVLPVFSTDMIWNGALSCAVQFTTLAAYVVAGQTLMPQVDLLPLMAASCVIMFAASLPISFAGWGLREMSAVVVLQAIGFTNAAALMASLLIGVVSLALLAIAAVTALVFRPAALATRLDQTSRAADYTQALDWVLPISVATAVFFQIYVPTASGFLNVNLADPVVLVGGTLYLLRHFKTGWPHWRVPSLNIYIVATTLVIVLAYLHGLAVFGFIDWSFANRLLGWGILLCYLATGALVVERAKLEGFEVFVRTFLSTAVAIILIEVAMIILIRAGIWALAGNPRIDGFSQNPNAFAFALLLALAANLTLSLRRGARCALLCIVFVGLWYAASRAAAGSSLIMLVVAVWCGVSYRIILAALLCTLVAIISIEFIPPLASSLFALSSGAPSQIVLLGGSITSDKEHWESVAQGFQLFTQHPIFGAGLGAFVFDRFHEVAGSNDIVHSPTFVRIIHSTPLWLLAETGIVGFAVFAAAVIRTFQTELSRRHEPVALMILLILCALGIMSIVHELLYQRAFWLLLGATLAYPAPKILNAAVPKR